MVSEVKWFITLLYTFLLFTTVTQTNLSLLTFVQWSQSSGYGFQWKQVFIMGPRKVSYLLVLQRPTLLKYFQRKDFNDRKVGPWGVWSVLGHSTNDLLLRILGGNIINHMVPTTLWSMYLNFSLVGALTLKLFTGYCSMCYLWHLRGTKYSWLCLVDKLLLFYITWLFPFVSGFSSFSD